MVEARGDHVMRLCLMKKEKKGGREDMRERSEFLAPRRCGFDGHAGDSVISPDCDGVRDTLETGTVMQVLGQGKGGTAGWA